MMLGLGAAGGLMSWVFGGWDVLLLYLVIFMVIDYFTGIIGAGVRKEITTKVSFVGLAKKVGILAVVAVAHGLDQLFASTEANIFGIEFPIIRTIVIWGYIINEVTSIMENIKRLGVPLPPILVKILSILKEEAKDQSNDLKK